MTNLELTEWLLKVREALAEQDEVKRNSMLRAADRYRKGSYQQSRVFHKTRIGQYGRRKNSGQFVQSNQAA
jgi:hypothetical protein